MRWCSRPKFVSNWTMSDLGPVNWITTLLHIDVKYNSRVQLTAAHWHSPFIPFDQKIFQFNSTGQLPPLFTNYILKQDNIHINIDEYHKLLTTKKTKNYLIKLIVNKNFSLTTWFTSFPRVIASSTWSKTTTESRTYTNSNKCLSRWIEVTFSHNC